LIVLRLFDAVRPVGVIRAGIDHLGIEKERVKIIREVVMEVDVVLVVRRLAMRALEVAAKSVGILSNALLRKKERQKITADAGDVAGSELRGFIVRLQIAAQIDQRAAGKIEALFDVLAN